MRCPKCQYITFDNGDRCRNCGYEFALAPAEEAPVDVAIARDEPASGRVRNGGMSAFDTPLTTAANQAGDAPKRDRAAGQRPISMDDLPLFIEQVADDQAPLVTPPAVPRPPLAVRRSGPALRPRPSEPEELSFDLGAYPADTPAARPSAEATEPARARAAGIVRRAAAGIIDVCILGPILAAVVYLTLRACELTVEQWRVLPLPPLAAFLLLLCGGYFVLFTAAGGQTIGKMATGIRVVPEASLDGGSVKVSFSAALVRAFACLGSVLALGAGFVPMLLSADRRAFHDRVADTRVVPA